MQENIAKTAAEWVFVAKNVAEMPGSESQILRCMAHAEALAKSSSDWTAIAKIAVLELRDSDLAQVCMSNAQAAAEDSDDWIQIADACAELGFDETEAICREVITALGTQDPIYTLPIGLPDKASEKRGAEWALEARKAIESYDIDLALAYIANAEIVATSTFDWFYIVQAWSRDFYDKGNAIRCLIQMEASAESASDWTTMAKDWVILLDDQLNARRCMTQAENLVGLGPRRGYLSPDAVSDWLEIVRAYSGEFSDRNNALRCMLQAEKSASEQEFQNNLDWMAIAEAWRNVFGNRNSVVRAMKKAESFAYSISDLEQVADAWQKLGYNEKAEIVRDKIVYQQNFLEPHDDTDGFAIR